MTRFHRKLVIACSGGPLLDGYLLSIIGVALAGITPELDLSETAAGLVGVAALVGMFAGGFVIGPLTDMFGRRVMYTVDLAVLVVASVACVFVTDAWQLIALRFLIGFAVGADYPIATALLTEWCPRRMRSRALGLVIVAWYLGAVLAYAVGYVVSAIAGPAGWRWTLGSAAVLSAIVLALRHGTPESPHWLVAKGRAQEARALIAQVLGVSVTTEQLVEAKGDSIRPGSIRQLFRGLFLRRIVFITLLYTCQVIPMWALLIFGPQLLAAFGFESDAVNMLGPALISALFMIGCIPALRLLETRGRRPVVIWSFALMIVPLFVLGLWQGAPLWVVIGCFCLYAFFAGAPGILEWLYPNELFPTAIRASAVGTAVALSKIGAAVGTYLVPVSLAHLGLAPTMYAGVAITAIGLVACIAWAEETKGRSLHEASAAPLAVPAAEAEDESAADDGTPEEARTGHTITPARRAS